MWGPRCAECEHPWPCRAALTADRDRLAQKLADQASELVSLRTCAARRWSVTTEAAAILGTDDPEAAVARLREMAVALAAAQEQIKRLTAALREMTWERDTWEDCSRTLVRQRNERTDEIVTFRGMLDQACDAVTWLLEGYAADENPGPGIRTDLTRWRAALAASPAAAEPPGASEGA